VPLGEIAFLRSLPAEVIATTALARSFKSSGSAVARLGSGRLALAATVDSNTAHLNQSRRSAGGRNRTSRARRLRSA